MVSFARTAAKFSEVQTWNFTGNRSVRMELRGKRTIEMFGDGSVPFVRVAFEDLEAKTALDILCLSKWSRMERI